ncbi:MAG: branched-chain amino acid ABC transporter permease, partial [Actinobacteria bacterium]|nr:branched-chain amino acid ABC transporter permease [Actinomycetota bacterium]
MSRLGALRDSRRFNVGLAAVLIVAAALFPLTRDPLDGFLGNCAVTLGYVGMALGLNIVVGFAGLLDLGYVAFYAIGAYSTGWLASDFFSYINHKHGIHVLVTGSAEKTTLSHMPTAGIHVNFLIIFIAAIVLAALAGAVIGLPTLRLRGDYIAIVTLAFGEIIGRIAVNGNAIHIGHYHLTNGLNAISPVGPMQLLPGTTEFTNADSVRPFYWVGLAIVLLILFVNLRLRDSRLGRAWIALREDEVAAASMGVPLVRTKLLAYATGAACGGVSGVLLAAFQNSVNANSFQFSFSIFVLAMVILGGLGSIWGVVLGAVALSMINFYLIPDVLNDVPSKLGLNFSLTQLSFGIFGFLLV